MTDLSPSALRALANELGPISESGGTVFNIPFGFGRIPETLRAIADRDEAAGDLTDENRRLREHLADLNNRWRHEFSAEVEAAANKLFKRATWPRDVLAAAPKGGFSTRNS
jgi:hypothetical protein